MSQTRVGVLGGGQLGRMLALAGIPLGLSFRFYEPADAGPVRDLGEIVNAPWDDRAALSRFADGLDVCTFEVENVPLETATWIAASAPVRPSVRSLACGRDRFAEKRLFEELGIESPRWMPVTEPGELGQVVDRIGLPLVMKSQTLGYDGRGVAMVHAESDIESAWASLGADSAVAESLVAFERELSILGVRASDGAEIVYPIGQNVHVDGMLSVTMAPALRISETLAAVARSAVSEVMRRLDHVGVLALEFFELQGRLIANEIAPRVHNSGHWTIEGAETSQFENHLRAILGLPLGLANDRGPSAMINMIGEMPSSHLLLRDGVHMHDYAKSSRPGRKVGHITVTGPDQGSLTSRLAGLPPDLCANIPAVSW